jgi:lipoate-protein ligase A
VAGFLESKILTQIDRPLSGLENMALDETMLERIPPGITAMVRVYGWSEPTLSLGHFQTMPQGETAAWSELPRVTRKTGGGAIVHHHEMTYCLAVGCSPSAGKKGHSDKLYRAIHNAIVDALRDLGWNAQLSEACTCNRDSAGGSSPFLCFDRRSPVDVVIDGKKIAGSAQRRTNRGLVQHGSLLMRCSEHTPHLTGVLEAGGCRSGVRLDEDWFVEILTRGLSLALS